MSECTNTVLVGYFSYFSTNKRMIFNIDTSLDGGYYSNVDTGLVAEITSKRIVKITLKKISKKDNFFFFTFRVPIPIKSG